MAETRSLQHLPNSTDHFSLFYHLDPTSLVLSQSSLNSIQPKTLQRTTDSYFMERGPRYNAYAEIRESKLRAKRLLHQRQVEEGDELFEIPKSESTPRIKKSVWLHGKFSSSKRSGPSAAVLAPSVPDFSPSLRKENRRPTPVNRIDVTTPPPSSVSKSGKIYGSVGKLGGGGSRSMNSGEKTNSGGLLMARKSYASIEELKGLSAATANALVGETRGGRSRMVTRRSSFGYRYN